VRVTLIDSPLANVANIARALRAAGAELELTRDPAAIAGAKKLVLPGVGSFAAVMAWLIETRIDDAIRSAVAGGASLLGICVGHQVLFDTSHEMGRTCGLGILSGEVHRFEGPLPVPQIGWNRVLVERRALSPPSRSGGLRARRSTGLLFDSIPANTPFYFVNSYAARNAEGEIASAEYNGRFTAAVQHGRVFGVQFHPEKSSRAGLRVLRNFVTWN
jgi:glutamine amidotransferase